MIIRAEKNKNYSVICNKCIRDKNISARSKGIFTYIMTLPDGWIIRREEIYQHFTEGRDALAKAFNELVKKGYIEKKYIHSNDGKIKGYEYVIYENTNIQASETSSKTNNINRPTENPAVGFSSYREIRQTGNPTLLSTDKEISTNKKISTDNNPIVPLNKNLIKKNKTAQPLNDQFDEFWKLYPNKASKKVAFKAYSNALKEITHEDIISAVNNQLNARMIRPKDKYTKNPSTWLNQGCYEDEIQIKLTDKEKEELDKLTKLKNEYDQCKSMSFERDDSISYQRYKELGGQL